jgi:succinate dehydrogenase/fumarate reductase flavoprotein subunit
MHPEAAMARKEEIVLDGEELPSEEGESVDLLVVGGGSAGFAAAIRAAELGAQVVLVEKGVMAGRASTWAASRARP